MLSLHRHAPDWFYPAAWFLHHTGKAAVAAPMTALAGLWLWKSGRGNAGLCLVLSALLATLNMQLVKYWVQRPRPMLWPRLIEEGGFSFPSGHSSFAAAAAVCLMLVFRAAPHRRAVWAACVLWAVAMGVSRVYLGVHYPSDVWAGWGNGVMSALLVCGLFGNAEKRP